MKTLAQAARIKRSQLNVPAAVSGITTPERRANEVRPPEYNGLLLKKPRFALTEEELRSALRSAAPTSDFDVVFLHSVDGVALLPRDEWTGQEQIQTLLEKLQPALAATIVREGVAENAELCEFDLHPSAFEPKILNEAGENTSIGVAAGGWNQVAARKGTVMTPPMVAPVGQKSSFTVLASKLAEAKKKRVEEAEMERRRQELMQQEVVEDWSAEVDE